MLGMISCKDYTELLSKSIDQKIGFSAQFTLKLHQSMCPNCRQYAIQLKWLHSKWPSIEIEKILPGLSDQDKVEIQKVIDRENV